MKRRRTWVRILALLCAGVLAWVAYVFASVYRARGRFPKVHYVAATKKSFVTFEAKRPASWVSIDQVSRAAKAAILMSEDARFFQHAGFDYEELKKAFEKNMAKKKVVRGASTISQQVAKNLFLTRRRSYVRKFKEAVYTVALEALYSKKQILEAYLNVAEWGLGMYGIRDASIRYFGKGPGKLNAKEGAFLATLLPSPVRYSVSFQRRQLTPFAQRHIRDLLWKMAKTGTISVAEAEYLEHFPLPFEYVPEEESPSADAEEGEENVDLGPD